MLFNGIFILNLRIIINIESNLRSLIMHVCFYAIIGPHIKHSVVDKEYKVSFPSVRN